jgi:hypothetical protein
LVFAPSSLILTNYYLPLSEAFLGVLMSIKSFGTLLIIVGIFLSFALFVFCQWNANIDFIANIRYATLIELSPAVGFKGLSNYEPAVAITLGQGLLLPFLFAAIGVLLNREILDSKFVISLLPFLIESSSGNKT